MIRFQQTFGAHAGRALDFDVDLIRIGRMPDSDIVFNATADLDASGRHAEVRREAGAFVLIDVGSRNGTYVNGQQIQRHILVMGDEIECGPGGPRLRVELLPGTGAAPARPDAATMAATPIGGGGTTPGDAPTMLASAPPAAGFVGPTPAPGGATPPWGPAPAPTPGPPIVQPLPTRPPPGPVPQGFAPPVQPLPPPPGVPNFGPGGPMGPAPRKYGERTVGLMIQSAVDQSKGSGNRGLILGIALGCAGLFLLAATAAVLVFIFFGR